MATVTAKIRPRAPLRWSWPAARRTRIHALVHSFQHRERPEQQGEQPDEGGEDPEADAA